MIDPITSLSNPKIKKIRRLLVDGRYRAQERQFIVEGSRWLRELVEQQIVPPLWLATAEWINRHQSLAAALTTLSQPPLIIDDKIVSQLTATATPSGVIAIVPFPNHPWPTNPSLVVILDGLNDPGNAGTILRTAAAAGVEGILIGPGTVDLTNPKVVRSSMGAVLRLPQQRLNWEKIGDFIGSCQVVAADVGAEKNYTAYDWTSPTALIIGREAQGLSPAAGQAAELRLTIPMAGSTESLNAAAAAAIMLFEAVRQRVDSTIT